MVSVHLRDISIKIRIRTSLYTLKSKNIEIVISMLRKMVVSISSSIFQCCVPLVNMVDRIEFISIFNFTNTIRTEVCSIMLKDGISIQDLKNDFITDLIIIENEGRNYICLTKGNISKDISKFIEQFDLKLDYPIIFDGNKCQFGIIGSSEELNNILKTAREIGWGFEILSVQKYDPLVTNAFRKLTKKQKEILIRAYDNGYFDYPRKINAEQLARKIGIHKTTLLNHLHKAEKRLISNIIGGKN